MSSLINSKIVQVLIVCLIMLGIAAVFYESFFGEIEAEERNEVNAVLLGSNNAVFEPVLPNTSVMLPQDFKLHPEYQHEWWHYFANVVSEEGVEYGVQWSFFRVASDERETRGWQSPQIYIAHIVITSNDKIWKQQRIARGGIGQAGMMQKPFKIWLDNWHWQSLGRTPFPGRLDVETDEFSVHLANYAAGPYVLNGDRGYQAKHDLLPVASYSVGAPFVRVKGQLEIEGKLTRIEGNAWLSKEWGSGLLAEGQQGWDLFSLRLDSGSTLMVNQYRHVSQPAYTFGTLANKKGDVIILTEKDIQMLPKSLKKLNNGRKVPLQWTINVPKYGISLETEVMRKEQWLPFAIPYWEGPVHATGTHKAKGLMQLTGY